MDGWRGRFLTSGIEKGEPWAASKREGINMAPKASARLG